MEPSLFTVFDVSMESGFSVRQVECHLERSVTSFYQETEPAIGYSYCLAGDMVCTIPKSGFVNHIRGAVAGLWKRPQEPVYLNMAQGMHRWIEVSLHRDVAERLLDENEVRFGAKGRALLCTDSRPVSLQLTAGADAAKIVWQILHCPFEGSMREYYIASKGMELFINELGSLCQNSGQAAVSAHARQVAEVAQMIAENPGPAVSIAALASHVGLSDSTLKRSFKRMYGISVFAFFQQHRMERARKILLEREMNVAEVAYSVGYSAPEHFSRAFKKHFGVSPKVVR